MKFDQEDAWLAALKRKQAIQESKVLSWINRKIRIPLSLSAQRDRFFIKWLKEPYNPFPQILDLGCGSGRQYFADRGMVTGVDLCQPLLDEARKIYFNCCETNILDIVVWRIVYDAVVSSDVIGHIRFSEKQALFDVIQNRTKPGGISIHFIECYPRTWLANLVRRRWPDLFEHYFITRPGHIGLETIKALKYRFRIRGFEILAVDRVPNILQEVGILSATLEVNKRFPLWLNFLIELDALLARNIWVREALNILLRPLAAVEKWFTPEHKTTAVMIAARKIS